MIFPSFQLPCRPGISLNDINQSPTTKRYITNSRRKSKFKACIDHDRLLQSWGLSWFSRALPPHSSSLGALWTKNDKGKCDSVRSCLMSLDSPRSTCVEVKFSNFHSNPPQHIIWIDANTTISSSPAKWLNQIEEQKKKREESTNIIISTCKVCNLK